MEEVTASKSAILDAFIKGDKYDRHMAPFIDHCHASIGF